jgi:hypothetical protein
MKPIKLWPIFQKKSIKGHKNQQKRLSPAKNLPLVLIFLKDVIIS